MSTCPHGQAYHDVCRCDKCIRDRSPLYIRRSSLSPPDTRARRHALRPKVQELTDSMPQMAVKEAWLAGYRSAMREMRPQLRKLDELLNEKVPHGLKIRPMSLQEIARCFHEKD